MEINEVIEMVKINLFVKCRTCSEQMRIDADIDEQTGKLIQAVCSGDTRPSVVADAEHSENRPIPDEFFKEAVIDDMCIDWLTGEYTGKRDRPRKRELQQLSAGDDGW